MMNQFTDIRFTVNSDVTASIHDNGIVILDIRSGRLYTCNQTGAHIWHGIEQQLPPGAIAKEISEEYQIAHSTSHENVVSFLADLELKMLIRREAE
jgi:hypothetical protein